MLGDLVRTVMASIGLNIAQSSTYPVRYADRVVTLGETDLHSDGFGFPWGQTRSWTNRPGYASGGVNGTGWVDTYIPRLIQALGSNNNTLVLISNGNTARYYDLVGGVYQPRYDDQSKLTYDAMLHTYTLTDTEGNQIKFNDFSSSLPVAQRSAFASYTDADGITMTASYTSDGHVAQLQRSSGTTIETYLYAYLGLTDPNAGLLASVILNRQVNGSSSTVRQVRYTYYDGTQTYGGNRSCGRSKPCCSTIRAASIRRKFSASIR